MGAGDHGRVRSFRSPKVAAPLKVQTIVESHLPANAFRSPKVAAPLKVVRGPTVVAVHSSFRSPKVAAPLKDAGRRPEVVLDEPLSAALKLRLH